MEKVFNKGDGKDDSIHSFKEAMLAAKETIGPSLKDAFVDSAEHLSTLADQAKKQVIAQSRDAYKTLNRNVHVQPWAYVAGAGVVGLAMGYFLNRKK